MLMFQFQYTPLYVYIYIYRSPTTPTSYVAQSALRKFNLNMSLIRNAVPDVLSCNLCLVFKLLRDFYIECFQAL